jgi:hypothetical protein
LSNIAHAELLAPGFKMSQNGSRLIVKFLLGQCFLLLAAIKIMAITLHLKSWLR